MDVGEDPEIFATTQDDVGEKQSFDAAEWVIGGDDRGTGYGNALEVSRGYLRADVEFLQCQANELHCVLSPGNGLVVLVQSSQAEDPIQDGANGRVQTLDAGDAHAVSNRERVPGVDGVKRVQLRNSFS
jgi:hypothetical protein